MDVFDAALRLANVEYRSASEADAGGAPAMRAPSCLGDCASALASSLCMLCVASGFILFSSLNRKSKGVSSVEKRGRRKVSYTNALLSQLIPKSVCERW